MKKTVRISALVIAIAMIFAASPVTVFATNESTGLYYISNGDGTCYVSGIGDCTDTNIIIPSISPDGDTVTAIGEEAFADCSNITGVTIPSTVTRISAGAFAYCRGLATLTVDSANTVYHSESNCIIETETKTLVAGCKNSSIPSNGSITSIGDYAFTGCIGLSTITIPSGVTSIGVGAFKGTYTLWNITIPDTITSIDEYAFAYCNGIREITIPTGVTTLSCGVFSYCEGLKSITIHKNVTTIESFALECCLDLETIYFEGSEQEWSSITKNSYWNYQAGANTGKAIFNVVFNTIDAPNTSAPETSTPETSTPVSKPSSSHDNHDWNDDDDWNDEEDGWDDGKVTKKTENEAPADKKEDGCNSSIGVSGLALVATLASCTVFVTKKKED